MFVDILFGTIGVVGMASGVSALMFYRKNGKNGHPPEVPAAQPVSDWQSAKMHEALQPLALLPQQLDARFEGFLRQLADAQVRQEPKAAPEWAAEIAQDLEHINDRLSEPAALPLELTASLDRIADRLETLLEAEPDLEPVVERLEALVALIREPGQRSELVDELSRGLAELPERFSHQMAEMLAAERHRAAKSTPAQGSARSAILGAGSEAEASSNPPAPPPRSAPPNLPRMSPAEPPATPSIPASYVAGTVFVPAGDVWSLLLLIQKQLSPNCPGSSVEFALSADVANVGPILVGAASTLGGPLSEANYAYQLKADSSLRRYHSTFPGGNTPVGELQVLAPSDGYLHVEVQS